MFLDRASKRRRDYGGASSDVDASRGEPGVTTTTDRTTTDDLLYEVDGHVGIITLNRPDRLNAISGAMLEALSAQLVACQ